MESSSVFFDVEGPSNHDVFGAEIGSMDGSLRRESQHYGKRRFLLDD
jgi:hypothetical protein